MATQKKTTAAKKKTKKNTDLKGALVGAQRGAPSNSQRHTAQLSSNVPAQNGVANWVEASGGKSGTVGKKTTSDPFLSGLTSDTTTSISRPYKRGRRNRG